MLWIGAIFGALFGWIGILVAALFWVTLALFKLIGVIIVFGFQFLLWIGAFLAKFAMVVAGRLTPQSPSPTSSPRGTRKRKGK
jgi:hypothetical protein